MEINNHVGSKPKGCCDGILNWLIVWGGFERISRGGEGVVWFADFFKMVELISIWSWSKDRRRGDQAVTKNFLAKIVISQRHFNFAKASAISLLRNRKTFAILLRSL